MCREMHGKIDRHALPTFRYLRRRPQALGHALDLIPRRHAAACEGFAAAELMTKYTS